LRSGLEDIARTHISFAIKECVYKWDVDFEQTWTHVVVRVELRPDSNVSDQTLAARQAVWVADDNYLGPVVLPHRGMLLAGCLSLNRFSFLIVEGCGHVGEGDGGGQRKGAQRRVVHGRRRCAEGASSTCP
jgi:hypothetical protein